MTRRGIHGALSLVASAILVACVGNAAEENLGIEGDPVASCSPVGVPLQFQETMAYMAGRYRLVMVSDDENDRSVGLIDLERMPEAYRDWGASTATLFGRADVGFDAVDAQQMEGLDSRDPEAPGVLVLESEGSSGPSIVLRFGREPNRWSGETMFDAAFTVLDVGLIEGDRFSGSWRSGVHAEWVEGYFCAQRIRS